MSWTDERVELLRQLWQSGLTASQIASQLSLGVTRNAVIGKVHRLGLSKRGNAAPNASPRVEAKPQSQPAPTPPKPLGKMLRGNTALATAPQILPNADAVPRRRDNVVPICEPVTLMDLRESMCRWPLGDPSSAEFRFCGNRSPVGVPYCETHSKLAFQPTQERRRDRDRMDRQRLLPMSN